MMIVESELLHYGSMAALLLGIRIIFAAIRPPVLSCHFAGLLAWRGDWGRNERETFTT